MFKCVQDDTTRHSLLLIENTSACLRRCGWGGVGVRIFPESTMPPSPAETYTMWPAGVLAVFRLIPPAETAPYRDQLGQATESYIQRSMDRPGEQWRRNSRKTKLVKVDWLIDWVRLNVPPTQYRSYGDWVKVEEQPRISDSQSFSRHLHGRSFVVAVTGWKLKPTRGILKKNENNCSLSIGVCQGVKGEESFGGSEFKGAVCTSLCT